MIFRLKLNFKASSSQLTFCNRLKHNGINARDFKVIIEQVQSSCGRRFTLFRCLVRCKVLRRGNNRCQTLVGVLFFARSIYTSFSFCGINHLLKL